MDENELRAAMRTTITLHPEPPPMESRTALHTARRAARRRNILASAGAVVAVLGVTVALLPGQGYFQGGTGYAPAAAPSAPVSPFPTAFPPDVAPSEENTKPSWPAEASGDATADSGAHYQKGAAMLENLLEVAPAGYTVPTGNSPYGIPWRYHQATFEVSHWAYLVSIPLVKDGRTGQVLVEVRGAGNDLPTDPCDLAERFWEMGGTCTPRTVGGNTVGVVDAPGLRDGADQWVAFRRPDGAVIYIAQGLSTGGEGVKPLRKLPFTIDQLAELASGDRFK